MKATSSLALAVLAQAAVAMPASKRQSGTSGFDISHYQGNNYDFSDAYADGARFVIIKATEGTGTVDADFSNHYNGATQAGLYRGGYHFAHPDSSSGADQANFFLDNGGGWSSDGQTLPGMVDLENNPSGSQCYGLSQASMVNWIQDFSDTYSGATGRPPMIYTTNSWWSSCTGDSTQFSDSSPLVLARYASSPGTIPGGWGYYSFWQYNEDYTYGGDSDVWNGDESSLGSFASG